MIKQQVDGGEFLEYLPVRFPRPPSALPSSTMLVVFRQGWQLVSEDLAAWLGQSIACWLTICSSRYRIWK